jgi:hypothetical protein
VIIAISGMAVNIAARCRVSTIRIPLISARGFNANTYVRSGVYDLTYGTRIR